MNDPHHPLTPEDQELIYNYAQAGGFPHVAAFYDTSEGLIMLFSPCSLLLLLLCVSRASADNWPAWRGPRGDGHTIEKNLPLHWGPTESVKWKIPLPERGNSTPVIWGERV